MTEVSMKNSDKGQKASYNPNFPILYTLSLSEQYEDGLKVRVQQYRKNSKLSCRFLVYSISKEVFLVLSTAAQLNVTI